MRWLMNKIVGMLAAVGVIVGIILSARKAKAAEVYKCPHCGQGFTDWDELFDHVEGSHPGERLPIRGQW
jgi:hypothetical protein